jgi:hypothetical protein
MHRIPVLMRYEMLWSRQTGIIHKTRGGLLGIRVLCVPRLFGLLHRVCVDNLDGVRLFEFDRETDSPARGLVQFILQLGEGYGDRL